MPLAAAAELRVGDLEDRFNAGGTETERLAAVEAEVGRHRTEIGRALGASAMGEAVEKPAPCSASVPPCRSCRQRQGEQPVSGIRFVDPVELQSGLAARSMSTRSPTEFTRRISGPR
jgi:hypothetical protein